ncbi:extradiol dioxygenase family protein [Saccharopolyspora lacisalsi]|uniref:Extradiol dioxygenase family protein n=1 Tax=Halosaccharopolyspora lacisalsi TaxID=1000566 RepID=A0A839DZW8_9PSEU|nr:extradiol dioxygenase family protein [Halosaccharopolyspora lacisalsi]
MPANPHRFHLAVPVDDLEAARSFYAGVLGFEAGRTTDVSVDWDADGHNFVAHLASGLGTDHRDIVDGRDVPVPHFGLVLDVEEFHHLAERVRSADVSFVVEPYLRFAGQPNEFWTMFFRAPREMRWSSRPSQAEQPVRRGVPGLATRVRAPRREPDGPGDEDRVTRGAHHPRCPATLPPRAVNLRTRRRTSDVGGRLPR